MIQQEVAADSCQIK